MDAALAYFIAKDAQTEQIVLQRPTDDDTAPPVPKRFLKSDTVLVRAVVKQQLQHIDRDCLSDPDPDLVNIFRRHPTKDIVYVARGTNTNERDNLDLAHKVLTATHIGKLSDHMHQLEVRILSYSTD